MMSAQPVEDHDILDLAQKKGLEPQHWRYVKAMFFVKRGYSAARIAELCGVTEGYARFLKLPGKH